jgi:glutamine amidotransferase
VTRKVTVVDYGIGNLLSVRRAFERVGAEVALSGDPGEIEKADRLVIPGVGAFGGCVGELRRRSLVEPVLAAMWSGRPCLGICVGMQMLMDGSEEFGAHAGLGVVAGRVVAIARQAANGTPHKVPFVGWANLRRSGVADWEGTILRGLRADAAVYFVHSYAAHPEDAARRLADYDYDGLAVCAAIRAGNVYGCQFHPEKSGPVGLQIIANFMAL